MLQIKGLYYSIGNLELLKGVEWSIPKGQRSALIGPNGAGKTTLFRIIAGELQPDKGRILKPKKYKIGYLPQEEINIEGGVLLDSVMKACTEIYSLGMKITDVHNMLDSNPEQNQKWLLQLGEYERRYESLGGYGLESRAQAVLSGLGFKKEDFNRELSEFSGGWRMRVHLARMLLQEPDLLLLDEPTNHLDLPSLEWLEQYLFDFPGTMIIVSHDRFFIDRLAQSIWELNRGQLEHYPGNYRHYEEEKKKKDRLLRKRWETQESEIKRQEEFIRRYRYDKKRAGQVQSRIKALEKMERLERPPLEKKLSFHLDVGVKSYKDVLKIKDLSFKYDKEWVLEGINLHLCRREKIALVGENGAGKTTLTRLIAEKLMPQKGTIELGRRTKTGYYAQQQAFDLNLDSTVFDEVARSVSTSNMPRIREALGIFQFSGDDVYKKISVLSGGEKARVSLVKILLSEVNFLIMDEPTNHLDLSSLEALEEALKAYSGSLMVISHDRFFLDKIVSRVVELKNKNLNEYAGDYSYYLEKRRDEREEDINGGQMQKKEEENGAKRKTKQQKRMEAEKRQRISKERNKLEAEISGIEQRIEYLENRKKQIENIFCLEDTHRDVKTIVSLQKELSEIEKELNGSYALWEERRKSLDDLLQINRKGSKKKEREPFE